MKTFEEIIKEAIIEAYGEDYDGGYLEGEIIVFPRNVEKFATVVDIDCTKKKASVAVYKTDDCGNDEYSVGFNIDAIAVIETEMDYGDAIAFLEDRREDLIDPKYDNLIAHDYFTRKYLFED